MLFFSSSFEEGASAKFFKTNDFNVLETLARPFQKFARCSSDAGVPENIAPLLVRTLGNVHSKFSSDGVKVVDSERRRA